MAELAPEPVVVDMRFVTPDIKRGDYYVFRAPITGGVKYVYPRMMGEMIYPVWWQDKHKQPSADALAFQASSQWAAIQAENAAEKKSNQELARYKYIFDEVVGKSPEFCFCRACKENGQESTSLGQYDKSTNQLPGIFWGALAFLGVSYLFLRRK